MALRLAREEGVLVGVSSGGNMVAAMRVAAKLKQGVIVTMFADSASKYLSESFWRSRIAAAVTAETDADNWP
jgi:cysteine synthase B